MLLVAWHGPPAPSIPSRCFLEQVPYLTEVRHRKTTPPLAASAHPLAPKRDNSRSQIPPYPATASCCSPPVPPLPPGAKSGRAPPYVKGGARESGCGVACHSRQSVHQHIPPQPLEGVTCVTDYRRSLACLRRLSCVSSEAAIRM